MKAANLPALQSDSKERTPRTTGKTEESKYGASRDDPLSYRFGDKVTEQTTGKET